MSAHVMTAGHDAANPFPALAPGELAALRTSIERYGVLVPIIVDLDGNILDGHHRLAIATELQVLHPITVIAPMPSSNVSDEVGLEKRTKRYKEIGSKVRQIIESFEWADDGHLTIIEVDEDADLSGVARTLNVDRRHLTIEQRRSLVADLRAKGTSIRGIATATGVSKTQVSRDIEQVSPTGHVNPDGAPDTPRLRNIDTLPKVTGTDGKSYPASKPKKANGPRKPKYTGPSIADLAAKLRAAQPEAQLAACREACVKFIEEQGWHEFSKLSRDLAEAYAEKVTVA